MAKYLFYGSIAILLGFLFYPRHKINLRKNQYFIKPIRKMEDVSLQSADLIRSDPPFATYDLGYVYLVDKAKVRFEDPNESGPKQFDVWVGKNRSKSRFTRAFSYVGNSREYNFALQPFQFPIEARWIQVVVNDWFNNRPNLKVDDFQVGLKYKSHTPIQSMTSNFNQVGLPMLKDLIPFGDSKWVAAQRMETEVGNEENVAEIEYKPPGTPIYVTADIGEIQKIYGFQLTTDGPGDNVETYSIAISSNGQDYQDVYISQQLPDETIKDQHLLNIPVIGRYIRLHIEDGAWHGDYAEIREFEVYTKDYRPNNLEREFGNYNAIQMQHERLGEANNTLTPHLTQGFAFDRETYGENRYFLAEGEEPSKVNPGNPDSARSFSYHYDTVKIGYNQLKPWMLYWVEVEYLQENNGTRIQNLLADGYILHSAMKIPAGNFSTETIPIPTEAYADGRVELHFNRIAGPNAVVSEVRLYEARPIKISDPETVESQHFSNEQIGRSIKVDQGIVIDGYIEDWHLLYPHTAREIDPDPQKFGQFLESKPMQDPVTLYTQWNEENFYIAAAIDHTGLKSTDRDVIHIFCDSTRQSSTGMYKTSDHHFVLTIYRSDENQLFVHPTQTHHHMDAIPKNINFHKHIDAKIMPTDKGYNLEICLPKDLVLQNYNPDIGKSIGFNYIYSVGDRSFAYASGDVNASPSNWNAIELVSQISGRIVFMDERLLMPIFTFTAGNVISLCVWDADSNTDRTDSESIQATLTNIATDQTMHLTLYETDFTTLIDDVRGDRSENSSLFTTRVVTVFEKERDKAKTTDNSLDILKVRGNDEILLTYIDPYFSRDEQNKLVEATVIATSGNDGKIFIDDVEKSAELIELGSKIHIIVQDADVLKNSEIMVKLSVNGTDESESIKLLFDPTHNYHSGQLTTIYSETPQPNDMKLQAVGMQTISVEYMDQLLETGEANVTIQTQTTIKIGDTAQLNINGRLISEDIPFKAGTPLKIELQDTDLNQDLTQREVIDVIIEGDRLQDQYKLALIETDADSSIFTASVETEYAIEADTKNNKLEVIGGEKVTIVYIDQIQGSGETEVLISRAAQAMTGYDGIIEIVQSNQVTDLENFNAGNTLYFRLHDKDIIQDVIEITITGNMLNDREKIVLFSTSSEGNFSGSISTLYSTEAQISDGKIQAKGAEKIQAVYLDGLKETGETNIKVVDTCETNLGTTGSIHVYHESGFDPDSISNPQINRFRANDTLILEIKDADLDTTNAVAQVFETNLTENLVRDKIRITMLEISGNAGVFRGRLKTDYGANPIVNDSTLQVQGGDIVTFVYTDALQNTGATQVKIRVDLMVEVGETGDIEIYTVESARLISNFSVGTGSFNNNEKLLIRLTDKDLDLFPEEIESAKVTVRGNVLENQKVINLRETTQNSGIFESTLTTSNQANADPSGLVLTDKEVIAISYLDTLTATGETGVVTKVQAIVLSGNEGILKITDRNESEVGSFIAGDLLYFWLEDLLLSTVVNTSEVTITVYGDRTQDQVDVVLEKRPDQDGVFVGVVPTRYGRTAIVDDTLDVQGEEAVTAIYAPQFSTINTTTVEDITYTDKGVSGNLTIIREDGSTLQNFNIGSTLYFRVEDQDLNVDPSATESIKLRVRINEAEIDNNIMLLEENENSRIFRGSIQTTYGQYVNESNQLGLTGGETITMIYNDRLIETGETNIEITTICRSNLVAWAARTKKPVVIDGLDDQWPLEKAIVTPKDEGLLWLQWDQDSLYFLAQIYDNQVDVDDPIRYYQGSDALELHIDLHPTHKNRPAYLNNQDDSDQFIFWACPKGGGFDGNRPYFGQSAPNLIPNYEAKGLQIAATEQENYYTIEARLPFYPILKGFDPIKMKRNNKLGFNFIIHRSDERSVHWAEQMPNTELVPPSSLGLLILEDVENFKVPAEN